MAPKSKAKTGAVGSAANVPARRSSAAAGPKAKAKGKAKATPTLSPEELAVVVWQGAVRGFQRQLLLARLKKERKEQDAELAKVMREAHAAAMEVDRKREEAKRAKEAEKRRKAKERTENTKKLLGAAFDGEEKDLVALLEKGLPVDAADHLGITALSESATSGFPSIANLLLEKKANPNSQGEFQRTPLWRAAYASHVDMVSLLLGGGADPRIPDDSGQCPVDVASKDDILAVLREWDVSKTDDLVEDFQSWVEETKSEEAFRQKQAMASVDDEFEAAKVGHQAAQMMLAKAKSQMRDREKEYGLQLADAKAAGHQQAREACASADAELQRADEAASAAQLRFDKVNLARMAAAEEHGVSTVLDGREVCITDLNNVLVRDLGDRIRGGSQWTLVIDPNGCAKKLMFYSGSAVVGFFKAAEMDPERLRVSLLMMIRSGGTLALDLACFGAGVDKELLAAPFERIREGLFGDLCNRALLQRPKGSHWQLFHQLITKEEKKETFRIEHFDDELVARFKFVVLTETEHPHKELIDSFDILRVRPPVD